jgi:hypothetical protein
MEVVTGQPLSENTTGCREVEAAVGHGNGHAGYLTTNPNIMTDKNMVQFKQ